jgi:hypothetical protein
MSVVRVGSEPSRHVFMIGRLTVRVNQSLSVRLTVEALVDFGGDVCHLLDFMADSKRVISIAL